MSTAQPERTHSKGETQAVPLLQSNNLQSNNLQNEITQQATSTTPTTKPAKNPKRVAAGKLVAERTRQARKAQKKAAAEAAAIIAKKTRPPRPLRPLRPLRQLWQPKTKALEAFSAPPKGLQWAVFSFH